MKSIIDDTAELKKLMNETIVLLSETDIVNNIAPFNKATEKMKFVKKRKKEIIEQYPPKELKKYDGELLILAKQIEKSFDNIIEEQKAEISALAAELEALNNRKKLIAYK